MPPRGDGHNKLVYGMKIRKKLTEHNMKVISATDTQTTILLKHAI